MDISKLEEILQLESPFRLNQAKQAIFGDLIENWSDTSTLSLALREKLNHEAPLKISHQLFFSKDNHTVKALIELTDGNKIETVLMRHHERNTVCVSSQVGCALSCAFCATGKMGFVRNLTAPEIIDQILIFARHLKGENQKVTNVVFMGMGEPLLNYDNVLAAIKYLNQKETLYLGARRFSISTSGIISGIERLANEQLEVNLALSLHALDDKLRSQLMPINKQYPIREVLQNLDLYQKKTRRKIMFEYIMIDGLNDSSAAAEALVEMAKRFICVINLIPCNNTGSFKSSSKEKIQKFIHILQSHHISVVQRFNYGSDISGACGQLANKH